MSGSSDPLWPLCAVETGEAIGISSRDELDGLAHALKAQRLTELGEIPIASREGRTLQLRRAYGVDLLANVAWILESETSIVASSCKHFYVPL
ncbi:hypothetical protein E4U56_007984 [Claviceps arundinis]|uniref:Uncharacterized protein n=1 Tax=Claviceps arundinis TaxID=1623583 RepID=A0A9P7MT45_9HYPO|nr:hypothetical protein E4U56_007984 [Claviceps arundinis]